MSMQLRNMGVARFAGLGVDPGAPTGSLRAVLQVRRTGDTNFSSVQLDGETGLLRVSTEWPAARLRVEVPPGTFMLKFFEGGRPVQNSPTRALGVGLGSAGSVNVQMTDGLVRLATPFHMSARVDWGTTGQVLATPDISTADEFRLVPDFALAYSAGGESAWDWTVYASASDVLEAGFAELDSPATLVTAPARPARQLCTWLLWTAITAALLVALVVGLGVGWGVSAASRRAAREPRQRSVERLIGDAVAVRRAADGRPSKPYV